MKKIKIQNVFVVGRYQLTRWKKLDKSFALVRSSLLSLSDQYVCNKPLSLKLTDDNDEPSSHDVDSYTRFPGSRQTILSPSFNCNRAIIYNNVFTHDRVIL